ncbi:MAG: c-type cytochrome [Arenimonas sp.]
MPFVTRHSAITVAVLGVAAAAIVAGAAWSGIYDIGADAPHARPVYALLETVRDRSIAVRAAKLAPPDLTDPTRVRQGAGNYAHMCAGCHRTPGGGATEMSRGLYPAPPDLSREAVDARAAFWTIKHGIKASGMPAWGQSMDDESMWNLAAFVQALPKLDATAYAALVASSGGHAHGGGDAGGMEREHMVGMEHEDSAAPSTEPAATTHLHADGTPHEHPAASSTAPVAAPAPTTHVHADGKLHEHPAEPTATPEATVPAPPAEEHDHEHHP